MLEQLERALSQIRADLYAGLIRARTDPLGVRAEAIALDKLGARLRVLLTELE